jgi:uncharacterized protein
MSRHFLEPLLDADAAGYRLVNERTGEVLAHAIELAADSKSRNRGLLGRSHLANGHVMIIAPCNAIHTFFMRFTIDVVFVDARGLVRKIYRRVRPWRVRIAPGSFAVLELAGGSADSRMVVGDRVILGPRMAG